MMRKIPNRLPRKCYTVSYLDIHGRPMSLSCLAAPTASPHRFESISHLPAFCQLEISYDSAAFPIS